MDLFNDGMRLCRSECVEDVDAGFKKLIHFMDDRLGSITDKHDSYTCRSHMMLKDDVICYHRMSKNSIPWLQEEIKNGNRSARTYLGSMMTYEYHTQDQLNHGIELLQKSIDDGDTYAILNLGLYHEHKNLTYDGNFDEALRLFKDGAKLGNSCCMTQLGSLYYKHYYGQHSLVDERVKWYKKAIELDNPKAMCKLSQIIDDTHESERLLRKSVELEYAAGIDLLGLRYCRQKRYREGIDLFRKGIELRSNSGEYYIRTNLNKESPQNRDEFDKMANFLDKPHTYPQTVKEWLQMEDEYIKKMTFKTMYEYFVNKMYIPKVLIEIIVSYACS